MDEVKLSKRANEILTRFAMRSTLSTKWRGPLPQKELARELGCSRWTIGRAIKKLKEAGLLVETGRDKQSRCKTYKFATSTPHPNPLPQGERGPTPQGLVQLENYRRTFELNFIHWPDWEKHYAAVTWKLKDVHCIHKLFRQTFDQLYEIRAQDESFILTGPILDLG